MSKKSNNNIDSYVINQAKYYSNKLVKNGYYDNREREDLFQEFIICYLKHRDNYNITKSSFKVYVTFIFQNLNKDLIIRSIERRKVPVTYYQNTLPPNRCYENNSDTTEYMDPLMEVSPFFMSLNMIYLKNTIDKLPNEELKEICYLIMDGYNILEIAKRLNLSRVVIYKKLKQIKKYFN